MKYVEKRKKKQKERGEERRLIFRKPWLTKNRARVDGKNGR